MVMPPHSFICPEGSNGSFSILKSTYNQVKDSFRDYDFIYTDDSVSDDKIAAAAVIANSSSIERLPNKSFIFSAKLHALYVALDRVESADDDEEISPFSLNQIKLLIHALNDIFISH